MTKWLSEAFLQIVKKKREVKDKAERERFTQLMQSSRESARRDKAFLNEQCTEIEENNRMGKTRNLFKKMEISREYFMQGWACWRTEIVRT